MYDAHDCCISFATQQVPGSLNILSYLHNVCRIRWQKLTKIGQKCDFVFKSPKILLFGRVSTLQKFFNDYISYTSIEAQLRICSLKISNHLEHICRCKGVKVPINGQNFTKTGYTNTFAPGNPSKHDQITFFS